MPPKAGVAAPPVGHPPNNGNPPNGGNGNAPNPANPVPPMVEDSDWGTWEAIKSSHSGEADDPELIPLSASSGISPDTPMLFSGGLGSVIFRLWLIPLVRETNFLFFHKTLVLLLFRLEPCCRILPISHSYTHARRRPIRVLRHCSLVVSVDLDSETNALW